MYISIKNGKEKIFFLIIAFSYFFFNYAKKASFDAYDALIAELDGKRQPRLSMKNNNCFVKKQDAVNTCIESLLDTLDEPRVIKPKEKRHDKKIYYQEPEPSVEENYVVDSYSAHPKTKTLDIRTVEPSPKKVTYQVPATQMYDQDFMTVVNRFKKNRDFGQIAIQQVIDLLDVELNVVRHLIAGHTGAAIEQAVEKRNVLLQRTAPISITMYDIVLSNATSNGKHATKLYQNTQNGKKLSKALTAYDQKMFLSMLQNNIEQYQAIMRDVQKQQP